MKILGDPFFSGHRLLIDSMSAAGPAPLRAGTRCQTDSTAVLPLALPFGGYF
jgi:hypothetical protein